MGSIGQGYRRISPELNRSRLESDAPRPLDVAHRRRVARALDRAWATTHRRAAPLDPPAIPTLIVAPHPDDETLLAGGLIAVQRSRHVDVRVLAVTDGEAAYGGADPTLAARRRLEQVAALDELGVGRDAVTRLGVPDGEVADHVRDIAEAIAGFDDVGLVVAPWTGDHHADHEAVGAAACDAVARTGSALLFGLFWTWHRREPVDLADEHLARLDLDAGIRQRRQRAIERHSSQFEPPATEGDRDDRPPQLTADLVRPLEWHAEYFVCPPPSTSARSGTRT